MTLEKWETYVKRFIVSGSILCLVGFPGQKMFVSCQNSRDAELTEKFDAEHKEMMERNEREMEKQKMAEKVKNNQDSIRQAFVADSTMIADSINRAALNDSLFLEGIDTTATTISPSMDL